MNDEVFFKNIKTFLGKLSQNQVDAINRLKKVNQEDLEIVFNMNESDGKTTSDVGISLIESFEDLKLNSYDDGVGVWTIGIGTTVYPNGNRVKKGETITKDQAYQYFKNDLQSFENTVNNVVKVNINQNQFDALVSLAYNIGSSAISKSTLIKKLNQNDFKGAAEQFLVWNKGGGKVMNGLVRRRKTEKELFEKK